MISRNGALYCFCKEEIQGIGEDRFKMYTMTYTDPKFPVPKTESKPICKTYY